jgi:hypothetical protein
MDNNFDNPNKIFKKEYNKFYKKHSKINNKWWCPDYHEW